MSTAKITRVVKFMLKGEKGDPGQPGLPGLQGERGEQGIPGPPGTSSYFHVKYAPVINPAPEQMHETPDVYIGTYVDEVMEDSKEPADYDWYRFQGLQGERGEQGIPGVGRDGKTSYLHIKYSNDGGNTFTANKGETPGDYIGQYTDFVKEDSETPGDYTWSKIKGEKGDPGQPGLPGLQGERGEQGIPGPPGTSSYFHIKYAPVEKPTAAQMHETPDVYIGTYVDNLPDDSKDPKKYDWYRFQGLQGETGEQGIPGVGTNGKTSYLHIKYSNDGGQTFTPARGEIPPGETPGDYIGQYTDFIKDDSMRPGDYTWSKIKGDTGDKGDAALTITVAPENRIIRRDLNKAQTVMYKVNVYKGGVQLEYGDGAAPDKYICSTLKKSINEEVAPGVRWSFSANGDDYKFAYVLHAEPGAEAVEIDLPFTITNAGMKYARVIHLSILAEGARGPQGPALRGPQDWAALGTGYSFEAGGDTDVYKDIVYFEGEYYSCVKSHIKSPTNYPLSIPDQTYHYWQLADKMEMVATNIILSKYALIKNLGVEAVEMKDADGNIIFQVKDGTVTANAGEFKNVDVSGAINARRINISTEYSSAQGLINIATGALILGGGTFILPKLPPKTCRVITWLFPLVTRSDTGECALTTAQSDTWICTDPTSLEGVRTLTINKHGAWRIIGVSDYEGATGTRWYIFDLGKTTI